MYIYMGGLTLNGYVAHTCIIFKLIRMCVQANMAMRVQEPSRMCMRVRVCMYFITDFSVCDMHVTCVSYKCCTEFVASVHHI